jgi:hypothetical protein
LLPRKLDEVMNSTQVTVFMAPRDGLEPPT